jgi:N-formylglutamate deformylase
MPGTLPGARGPFVFSPVDLSVPVVATAIHAGHDMRAETAARTALPEPLRAREEDLLTDRLVAGTPTYVVATRSRFEVDLNRRRDQAVYLTPEDAWGNDPWKEPLPPGVIARSQAVYDAFHQELGDLLDSLAERGPFAVLDVHSYNHRRQGPGGPTEPPGDNPEVNLGTGTLDRDRWAPAVDALGDHLASTQIDGRALDVRENVRFTGGHLSAWVNGRYRGRGGAVAVEFKKVFMDEWSGAVDAAYLATLADAVATAVPRVADAVRRQVPA